MIEIPTHLLPPGHDNTELEELYSAIVTELCDEDYETLTHHKDSTYLAGCRGPICRKAHREYAHRRNPSRMKRHLYDPVLMYLMDQVTQQIRAKRREIPDQLMLDLSWEKQAI